MLPLKSLEHLSPVMIYRCFATTKGFPTASLYPGFEGSINTVYGKAVAFLQVAVEFLSQSFKMLLLHPASMNRNNAKLK